MTFARLSWLASATTACCLAGAAGAQPSNDTCAGATVAVAGANAGTLVNANSEDSENSCEGGGGADIFFTFVPPATGAYSFSLCQDAVFFDSIMSIHTGCPTSAANEVACDDDGCGFFRDLSVIPSVTLQAGLPQPYIIRVTTFSAADDGASIILNIGGVSNGACCLFDGNCITTTSTSCTAGVFQGTGTACIPSPCPPLGTCCNADQCCSLTFQSNCAAGGTWTLGGTCNPSPCATPANDTCATATPLVVGVPVTGSNCSAGDDQLLSCAFVDPTNTHKTVWYSFTPAHTAAYTFNSCGTSFDTTIGVFSGTCGGLTEIACNDDSSSTGNVVCPGGGILAGLNSRIPSLILDAGTTYYVLLAAWGQAPAGGPYVLAAGAIENLGACCNGTACTQTDQTRCGQGTFRAGDVCSPNPCLPQTGACCAGATCSLTTVAACTGEFRAFAGLGTVCNVFSSSNPAQNRTPCCLANYNQSANPVEPTVQDIFDFLTGYFTNDPLANINGSANPVEPTVQDIFDFLTVYFNGCAG